MYVVVHVVLVVVAIFFWRRYPRPSLYLAAMMALEVIGILTQMGLQFFFSRVSLPIDSMLVVSIGAMIRLLIHILAMGCLVMAVYVGRGPNTERGGISSGKPGVPGMEGSDQAFALDSNNPYSPPRQPR